MRQKRALVKDNKVLPESTDSGATVPGTAQSGAIEQLDSAAGVDEVGENDVIVTEPGTAESGAREPVIESPSNRSFSASREFLTASSGFIGADSESGTSSNGTASASAMIVKASAEPVATVAESVQTSAEDAKSGEDTRDKFLDIDLKMQSAHESSQAGDFVGANAIYQDILLQLDSEAVSGLDTSNRTDGVTGKSQEQNGIPGEAHEKSHAQLVECLWSLANNLYLLNDVESSIPLFKRLVLVQEAKLGSDNDQLITPLLRLAIALKRAGEVAESEETFQRSMTMAKRVNPEGHIAVADANSAQENVQKSTFVHPLAESMQSQDSEHSDVSANADKSTSAAPEDSEAEVLKYLFSDNAPAHVVKKMTEIKQNKPSAGRTNVLSRSSAPIDYEKGFIDRNPAATRLSELDLAALGAIPSTDVMKSMFSEASFSDPQTRSTRSTAFLKANESGEEPLKFADSTKRFDAKESAPLLVRNKWFLPTLVVVAAILATGFIAKSFFNKSSAGHQSAAIVGASAVPEKTFASFDKQTVLQTYKNAVANFTNNNKSHRAVCHFLDGDPRDLLVVIPGSYSGSDLWMQQTADGLKLSDGTILYSGTAPLNGVVKQMTSIAQAVQAYYGANHSYPTTPDQFQAAMNSAVYMNAFTHKGDPPKFYTTYSSSLGSSAKKLEVKTEAGENWINETAVAAGEIHCCCLIYEDPAGHQPSDQVRTGAPGTSGNGTDFFIRGGDADGHFIQGNKPGSTFYIELNQGKSSELTDMLNMPSKPLDLGKTRILVAKDFSEQMFFLFLSGAIPALFLMAIGGGWFIQHQLYEDNDQLSQIRKKVVTQVLVVSSALLALWIAICALG